MSVVSENAIVITATMDTSDVKNGVERIGSAVKQIGDKIKDIGPAVAPAVEQAGGQAGSKYLKGFLGRFLLRDAIRGIFSGLVDVAGDFGEQMVNAFGAKIPKGGFLKGFESWIADGLFNFVESLSPTIQDADRQTREKNITQINADKDQALHNEPL